MKQVIVLILLFYGASMPAQQNTTADQSVAADQVPVPVIRAFTDDHPGETGSWTRTGEHYRVRFIQRASRVAHTITYDAEGNIVKRDSEVKENKEQQPATDRYLQPADTSRGPNRPAPPSEVLRVEDPGMPPAPPNERWKPGETSAKD